MNVGIISMQRVYNHGSFLQSYGLKALIEEQGHTVRFVDLRPGENLCKGASAIHSSTPFYVHTLKKVNHILFNRTKNKRFEKTYFPISGINAPVLEKDCDMVVVGSDEVFNFYQDSPWGFTDQLFGKTDVPAISYAGSFGNTDYRMIEKLRLADRLKDDMSRFRAISVRDQNSFQCVRQLLGTEPEIHLDPVLIYDFAKEQSVPMKLKFQNYIAVYSYDNRIRDEEQIKKIREFAKKRGKKLISLGFFTSWCDYNLICSPFELLAYFRNADYVITDTFHGTVISIKQNKKFVTIVQNQNSNKLGDLLARFRLQDRQLVDFERFEEILETDIDYERVNAYVAEQQANTRKYLRENLT